MKEITKNTRLYTIRHLKEFENFKDLIICPRQVRHVMQVYKLKTLGLFYPLNADCCAETLEYMRSYVREGKKLYVPFDKNTGIYSFVIGKNRPFVLILPGGGYGDVCSLIEGYQTAVAVNKLGYNAFIGVYSVGKRALFPNPVQDVAKMLKYIFDNAESMQVDINGYAICGFSAGGHLAASWCTDRWGYKNYSLPAPKVAMLCYPVIMAGKYAHKGSIKNIIGKENLNNQAAIDAVSIEKQVTADYPKTYIWQCESDNVVSVENSKGMVEALNQKGVTVKLNIVDGDKHGWGLAINTSAEGWLEEAIDFWQAEQ